MEEDFARIEGLDDPDQIEEIFFLTQWLDQQRAIARYGYPKDNAIPPPLCERLDDPDYVEALAALCEEADEVEARSCAALRAHAARLRGR
jgi:hypothetical protein